jgi:hypothetical protein
MLFPLFSFLLLTANVETAAAAAVPTPWPEKFHAVLLTNLTGNGGQLELIDVYYDWPRGRTLNVVRGQLSGEPLYNVEWVNGSSYLFASSSCTAWASCRPTGSTTPPTSAATPSTGSSAMSGATHSSCDTTRTSPPAAQSSGTSLVRRILLSLPWCVLA